MGSQPQTLVPERVWEGAVIVDTSVSLSPLGCPLSPNCKPVFLPGPGDSSGLLLAQLCPLQQNLPELHVRSLLIEAQVLPTRGLDVAGLFSTANPLKPWSSSADLRGDGTPGWGG